MPVITTTITTDEKTFQTDFYKNLFGEGSDEIKVDRSTDGYTRGILFEHKTNIKSYGESKALGQALIYLARFNRDGVPVPAKICLVGQEEQKCYVYDTANYMHIVNDIPKYANLKASDGIAGFQAGQPTEVIDFDMTNIHGMQNILAFVQKAPQTVKIDITKHNVYGWAMFYYDNAPIYKQKAEKKKFFEELRNPVGTLEQFINTWNGDERDFEYIMDMLNDPMTQKKLGAFYTPPAYAKKATELVKQAIARVPDGNDYVIIDRCAGTGNLEMWLDDGNEDILSHVIVSTYELKEWMVLKDRYNGRVRYIIPPVPANPDDLPDLNEDGFLSGANALTRDIIDNPVVRSYLDNPNCTIILYENPPYAETIGIEYQKRGDKDTNNDWKQGDVVTEMKQEVSGNATNDMGNAFIWSAFKYFLRQPTDSYIVFSPVKYWKAQHLIDRKFIKGFAFNRKHFHAPTDACIMCAYWSFETDKMTQKFDLQAYNLSEDNELIDEGVIAVKKVNSLFSEKYYDKRSFDDDTEDGIACELDGTETTKPASKVTTNKLYNTNIIGYMIVKKSGFDNARLTACLLPASRYDGSGFYLRSDNFVDKLPMFAASRYTDNCNDWKIMSMVMKSGDKSAQFEADVASGQLDKFLCQTLIWTGFTHYAHMRSLEGSDGRFYKNELCFDNIDGKSTLARTELDKFIADGYELTNEEKALFEKWEQILDYVQQNCSEYHARYTYGLYQIDEEINIKAPSTVKFSKDGTPVMDWKYGDLNNLIKDMKAMVKQYYLDNLVDTLFEYEFLK